MSDIECDVGGIHACLLIKKKEEMIFKFNTGHNPVSRGWGNGLAGNIGPAILGAEVQNS